MSLPRILAQVLFLGSQIVGKAFVEAGRQAVRNARAGRVEGAAGAAAGGAAAKGTVSEQITRLHRMTMDEAKMILNFKTEGKGQSLPSAEEMETMIKNYEHLFKTNAPPAPKGQEGGGAGSFYIQSKVVRARERIEAEWEAIRRAQAAEANAASQEASASSGPSEGPGSSPGGGR